MRSPWLRYPYFLRPGSPIRRELDGSRRLLGRPRDDPSRRQGGDPSDIPACSAFDDACDLAARKTCPRRPSGCVPQAHHVDSSVRYRNRQAKRCHGLTEERPWILTLQARE